jgi:hypothetical protein
MANNGTMVTMRALRFIDVFLRYAILIHGSVLQGSQII